MSITVHQHTIYQAWECPAEIRAKIFNVKKISQQQIFPSIQPNFGGHIFQSIKPNKVGHHVERRKTMVHYRLQ